MSDMLMFKPKMIKIEDPLIDIESRKYFACLKGGVETTEREFVSNTFSNSSTVFSVPPPNPTTFVSRRFLLKQPVTVTISGSTTDGGNVYRSGYDAFRAFPIASIIQTLDIALNGASVALQMNEVIQPLLMYHNNERDLGEREMSMTPSARDQSQQYAQLVNSNRNPLGTVVDGGLRSSYARGAFPYTQFDNSPTECTLSAVLTEELMMSPLLFGGVRDEGFIGLQKIEVQITWDSNLQRIWSHAENENVTIDGITVQLGQPSILFRYVTPPMNMSIPRSIQYSYNEITRYPTNAGLNIPDGQDLTVVSNNIQLNAIPRYLYLFVRKSFPTFEDPDAYFAIKRVRINWNNQNALLSNASQQQLYDISRKNGVDVNYISWTAQDSLIVPANGDPEVVNGVGSVLCLEMGTDIGLREDECPGLIGTYNIQVEMDVENKTGMEVDSATFYIITIIPGCFTIYDNSANKRIGILSRDEVLSTNRMSGYGYYDLKKNLMSGGFRFSPKKWLKKAARVGSKAARTASAFTGPRSSAALGLASGVLGKLGRKKRRRRGGAMVGGRRRVKRGGKMMSKAQLRRFLAGR